MLAKRKAFNTDAILADMASLRDACKLCENCKGACLDLLQVAYLPSIVLHREEAHS